MGTRTLIFLALFIFAPTAFAGTSNVILGETLCSPKKHVCVKATIDFHYSKGNIQMHGRVKKATRPGQLRVRLHGFSRRKNQSYRVHVAASIEGKYSELFKGHSKPYKYLEDRRDIKWRIESVEYD